MEEAAKETRVVVGIAFRFGVLTQGGGGGLGLGLGLGLGIGVGLGLGFGFGLGLDLANPNPNPGHCGGNGRRREPLSGTRER